MARGDALPAVPASSSRVVPAASAVAAVSTHPPPRSAESDGGSCLARARSALREAWTVSVHADDGHVQTGEARAARNGRRRTNGSPPRSDHVEGAVGHQRIGKAAEAHLRKHPHAPGGPELVWQRTLREPPRTRMPPTSHLSGSA